MTTDDVSPSQAERLQKALAPQLTYLYHLQRGMEKAGFLPSDLLFQLVSQAYDATQALSIEAHYLSSRHTFQNRPGWPRGNGR